MTRYALSGDKTVEIYKRSIVTDLCDQQRTNVERALAGSPKLWKKHKRSLNATRTVEEEFRDCSTIAIQHYFYDAPPSKRAFVFDGREAVVSYYEPVRIS